jgi:hypothetical protein
MSKTSHRRNVILTVEPLNTPNNDYRLGLMKEDFEQLRESSKRITSIEVAFDGNTKVEISKSLTVYRNHGKLVNSKISEWILSNRYNETEKGKPTKLVFEFKATELKHTYKLYTNQGK